jgi:prepilin-type processing-associated H-X9-DG protein
VFHCPADKSYAIVEGTRSARVRSYAMNMFMGTDMFYQGYPDKVGRMEHDYLTLDQVNERSAANLFVFADEHEDSIDDGRFIIGELNTPANYWLELPASRHGKAANLSFADGHVETHRWQEASTLVPIKRKRSFFLALPGPSRDVLWFREHATDPVVQ